MKITETKLEGVLIIDLDVFNDDRGWFAEFYNKKKLAEAGVLIDFVQVNHSFTKQKGTLRGLHFQNHPHAQAKLVSCIKGAILDVVVDLRKNSPTYKQWLSVELSETNKRQLFVPRGFAHGILTLTDDVHIYYKIDNHYNKQAERFLHYNDTELNIDWGTDNPILIERDANAPFLKDCDVNFD
ncbi:MAG: dTDP-4-dehydrorhamnose 3,5-epimerase [bacterium]|nr:dTDP-4-dehydrorhamnose 3,5-epimerase [bacterium]